MQRSSRWKLVGAVAVLVAVSVAARRPLPTHGEHALRPVPAAPFASFDAASRAELVAYGRSLTFDTSYHASDTRRLMSRMNGRIVEGPIGKVMPEIGSTSVGLEDMAHGRILWRIEVDDAYPEQGFAKGVNYIWVDSSATGWRAVVVPENATIGTTTSAFRYNHLGMVQSGTAPRAQWRWNDKLGLETVWEFCAAAGCCEVMGCDRCRPRP
jgi:hypothetical protein